MAGKVLVCGAGGHAAVVLDIMLSSGFSADDIGIVDPALPVGSLFMDVAVVGRDSDISMLYDQGYHQAFVAVGSIGDLAIRQRVASCLEANQYEMVSVIHPRAIVGRGVSLGKGIYVGARAVVNANSVIDDYSILNTGCIVEHNCRIGKWCHLSPGSTLCGSVCVGDETHIGAQTVVRQGIAIGKGSLIGIGSVVTHPIGDYQVAYGNPCKEERRR